MRREPETVTITQITHDLLKKTSVVGIAWEDERRLFLQIPYGTTLENVSAEAERALKDHSEEMAKTTLKLP